MGEIATAKNTENQNTSLKKIIKDLLAKERRAHILTIMILAPALYLLGQWNLITPEVGAFAFISLMCGYCTLALMTLNEKTIKMTQIKYENKVFGDNNIIKKISSNMISALTIMIIPLTISSIIFGTLLLLMGENKPLSSVG